MSGGSGRWDDLSLRVITGVALAAAGGVAIWRGGAEFAIVVALAVGVMIWELAFMVTGARDARALRLGVLAGVCVLVSRQVDFLHPTAFFLVPAVAGVAFLRSHRVTFALCAFCIAAAGYGLAGFRDEQGAMLTFWLAAVVLATDIAGYFGGRLVGGRKFWPRVSPGKTWAGVVSGWVAAAAVGLAFVSYGGVGLHLVWFSVSVSLASQSGDLAGSAVKRRAGVKDSGGSLPGHGGFLDRFDGLAGAALFVTLVQFLHRFP